MRKTCFRWNLASLAMDRVHPNNPKRRDRREIRDRLRVISINADLDRHVIYMF